MHNNENGEYSLYIETVNSVLRIRKVPGMHVKRFRDTGRNTGAKQKGKQKTNSPEGCLLSAVFTKEKEERSESFTCSSYAGRRTD